MIKIQIAALIATAIVSSTGINQGRSAALCAHAEATQAVVTAAAEEKKAEELRKMQEELERKKAVTTPKAFRRAGVMRWNGWRWTWYSERALPGRGLKIPGRHTDSDGFVCDQDGYICLASGSLKKGTVVDTPFGREGKVYDCGCASNTLDVYVNW